MGRLALRFEPRHRLEAEGDEDLGAEPASLVSDDAVGEVSSRVEHCQPDFGGGAVDVTFALPIRPQIVSAMSASGIL